MIKVPLEIVIPIYNEGENVIKLLRQFESLIKNEFRVLLCYDDDDDNIFDYKNDIKKFKFEVLLVKNPDKGPCAVIKKGLNYEDRFHGSKYSVTSLLALRKLFSSLDLN